MPEEHQIYHQTGCTPVPVYKWMDCHQLVMCLGSQQDRMELSFSPLQPNFPILHVLSNFPGFGWYILRTSDTHLRAAVLSGIFVINPG